MATNYGKDTSCTTSLRSGRYSTGARLVAESAYRRLITPRGMLRGGDEEANYGLDLTDLIGSAVTKHDAAALGIRIKNELLKDERIVNANVEVLRVLNGPAIEFTITINAETDAGPFDLQLSVDEVSVDLIGISEG